MALGGFGTNHNGGGALNDRMPLTVVMACIVAASGGLMFGYDHGISGGVTTMMPFLRKFFPTVLRKAAEAKTDMYCVYNSQVLTAFTSSLYIAALVTSLVASRVSSSFGRKFTMLLGGCSFLVGTAINGGSTDVAMLIIGRIFLGFGVGFVNQATPIYLSELAPPKWRGSFATSFHIFIGIGVMAATITNFGAVKLEWGWRLSLVLAAVPALVLTVGALFICDTPSSLVERGKVDQAKRSLVKIRGKNADVDAELAALIKANKASNQEPFLTIFKRQYRPQLVMAFLIPIFNQLTGNNIISFYAPVLFRSVGLGSDSALVATIILGGVNFCSVLCSTLLVDRFGRRVLFLGGGLQMLFCQVAVAVVLGVSGELHQTQHIPKMNITLVLVFFCIFVGGFGLSWGPLGWLIPSEIFPLKIRQTGQSISTALHFAMTFVLAQTFLSLFCHFKYGVFLFYAGWLALMTVFVALFLPETKGIPLESMHVTWERHWFWKRYVKDESN